MKKFVFLLLMLIPLIGYCQTEEEKYYIYNIVSFEGEFTKENFKVFYDDGKEVKRLRNDKDDKMRFTTPAGALMYLYRKAGKCILVAQHPKVPHLKVLAHQRPVLTGFCVSPALKKNLKRQSMML